MLSFLFIANFVMFSIIQGPLYAFECDYEECDPWSCQGDAWDQCDWQCQQSEGCYDVQEEDAYCAPGPWWPCECFSLWTLICEDETEFYWGCHEMNTMDCPFGPK